MKDVETLKKARYKAMESMLVAFVVFYLPFIAGGIANYLPIDKLYYVYVLAPQSLIGAIWLFVALNRLMKVQKSINADDVLKQALNNEQSVASQFKCFRNAFFATIISIGGGLFVASIYPQVSAILICYIVLFAVLFTMGMSWLNYNKE